MSKAVALTALVENPEDANATLSTPRAQTLNTTEREQQNGMTGQQIENACLNVPAFIR